MDRLNRIAYLPTSPYDQGPTITGQTKVVTVDADKIDQLCRAILGPSRGKPEIGLPASAPPPSHRYRECYDPVSDTGYIPNYPSQAERERLTLHMLGHARGGAHDSLDGRGEWHEAPWAPYLRFKAGLIGSQYPTK